MEKIRIKMFDRLGVGNDISNGCISGTVNIRNGSLSCTVIHVCGKKFSFMKKPEFFACSFFFANCSFVDCCSKKLMPIYNKKNKDKIQKFSSLEDLENFINSQK